MFGNRGSKEDNWIKANKPCLKLLDNFGVGVAIINSKMEILALNGIMKKWFPQVDVNKKPICYKTFNIPPKDDICDYCVTIKTLKDGKIHETVTKTPVGDKIINYRVVSSPIKDENGNIIASTEVVEDVTRWKKVENRLAKINQCFLSFREDPDENINLLTKLCGELMEASCALYNRLEGAMLCSLGRWQTPPDYISEDKAEGHICYDVIRHSKDQLMVLRNLKQTKYAQTDPNVIRYNLQTYIGKAVKCGDNFIGSLCVVYDRDFVPGEEDKNLMEILASAIGVEEERRAAKVTLEASEEKYRKLFEDATDAIFMADAATGKILDANKQAEKLLGRPREEIIGMHQSELHPKEDAEWYRERFKKRAAQMAIPEHGETDVINKEGVRIPVLINASLQEINGIKVILGIFRDISEFKKIEKEKKEAEAFALIDPHTQVYNYRYLQRRIRSEFEEAKRRLGSLSLLMIDIDYFKSINDTYGHEFGDAVLKDFAALLQHTCREIDIVTRFEGESFAIILPDTDAKGAFSFAERIQNILKKHKFGKYKVRLMVSIGVASYPENGTTTVDKLITNADTCVHTAKEKGGNAIYVFEDLKRKKGTEISIDKDSQKRIKEIGRKFSNLVRLNRQNTVEAVYALAQAVGAKNAYTQEHSEDMVYYATEVGKKLNLSEEELENLKHGAMLHDIGKLGISDKILLKPGKLTKKEFEAIKKHPQIGADIIRPVHFLKNVVPVILHHHERYDGNGYGSKLEGEEIPLGARILAVVDVYQALVSNRPYRKAYSKKEAIKIMKEETGKHFDPKIIKVFLEILAKDKKRR